MAINRTRRPTHPGAILREDVVPNLGISQGEFADVLGVSRRTVNMILQEHRPVTVDMAHRLARALGTSADVWLRLQAGVDLWDALEKKRNEYDRISRIPGAEANVS